MGLRFRRSVKIMPGVRLNFSSRGVSTTIGPRGASVNLGARGAFLNLGLAGTGLSYRSQLTGPTAASPRSTAEPLHLSARTTARWEKQQERDRLRELAQDLHAARETQLEALRDILRNRSRDQIDWVEEYGSRGPYEPQPFHPPPQDFASADIQEEVRKANPVKPWVVAALAAFACGLLAPQPWLRVPAVLAGVYFFAQAIQLARRRPKAAAALLRAREEQHASVVDAAKNKYGREQAERAERHKQEEELRTRIREAVLREDAEILAALLEVELSNEDLPLPVEFDIEFDGVGRVQLEVELPSIDAIPLTVSSLTKTGKFSERKMAVRARVALYQDVCAGLALRLVHEVFRVLPFVEHVDLSGLFTGTDSATGNPARRLVLRLSTDRSPFLQLSLDNVDPSQALAHLGGEMKSSRDGVLKPLEAPAGH